jgi:hypothetical protein
MKRTSILLSAVALFVLAGVVLASAAPPLDWWVIGGGGGHAEAGIYTLEATIGQPAVGTATRGSSELCAGFWCEIVARFTTYLPNIMKNYGP